MSSRAWIAIVAAVVLAGIMLWRTEAPAPPEAVREAGQPNEPEVATVRGPTSRATVPSATTSSPKERPAAAPRAAVAEPPEFPTISGRVVDRNGNPLAGVPIGHEPWIDNSMASTRSDSRGRFKLSAPRADAPPIRLIVSRPGEFVTDGDTGLVPWHSENVIFVVQRGGECEVEALDAMTGQPIRVYDVFVASARHANLQDRPITRPIRIRSRDGIGTVDQLVDGKNHFWILPVGHDYRLTKPITTEIVIGRRQRITARVQPTVPVAVTVLDPAGNPVSRAKVTLIAPGRDEDAHTYPARQPLCWDIDGETVPFEPPQGSAFELGWGTTDENGWVRLGAFSDSRTIDVHVEAPGHPDFGRRSIPIEGLRLDLTLRLPSGARIIGTVIPAAVGPFEPEIFTRSEAGRGKPVPVGEDGSFSIGSLAAGEHRVQVAFRRRRQFFIIDTVLATVLLAAGETRHLDLDISECLPGRLEGTAIVDGAPWSGGIVRLHDFDGRTQRNYIEQMTLDSNGTFRCDLVPPGEYRLVGLVDDTSFEFEEPIEIRADSTARITFRATRR